VRLRILTRFSEKVEGAENFLGDLAKPETLNQAMKGVDKVFLLSSPAEDELTWHKNAIDAASRAGISHLVRNSILGADSGSAARLISDHGEADDYLRASGVSFTIIRPNFYMQNVASRWPPTIDPKGNYYAPAGNARLSMVDVKDVAAVAAHSIMEQGHVGKEYNVTGPESLTHAEACEKLGRRLGDLVTYVPVDDEAARQAMTRAGLNKWLIDAVIELYQDYRRSGPNGYASKVYTTVRDITGAKPRSLDQSLAEELAVARGRGWSAS
jgi:uncharacterized protein YbjT (DUF2867 family)